MTVRLHIDRVVVDEALLRGERRADVRAALEEALRERLAAPGAIDALRHLGAVPSLPAQPLPAATAPAQRSLGARIAAGAGDALGLASAAPAARETR